MVSQTENVPLPTPATTVDDRGIRETHYGTAYVPGNVPSLVGHYNSFWGSVIAGTVIAISLSVLSYALMFACHVGLYNPQGDVNWGVGAVIWSAVTAAITFFIGGLVASLLMPLDRHGWIHGFSVWGLSVPLVLLITSFVAIGTSMTYGGMAPTAEGHVRIGFMPTIIQLSAGVGWMLFISLASGLVFAILGGLSGGNRDLALNRGTDYRHSDVKVGRTSESLNVR
jgi:hypothetical protein